MTEIIEPGLESALKNHKERMNSLYSELIANPYRAQTLIDDIRREVVRTAATLMENRIPLNVPKKPRTMTDVLQEAAAEAGITMRWPLAFPSSATCGTRSTKQQQNQSWKKSSSSTKMTKGTSFS